MYSELVKECPRVFVVIVLKQWDYLLIEFLYSYDLDVVV